jgi:methyl-accepting chemotaxis protein
MDHVGHIAGSVDDMVARVNRVTMVAERAAGIVDKAADVANSSIAPAVSKLAGLIAGVSAGTRAFFTKSKDNGSSDRSADQRNTMM